MLIRKAAIDHLHCKTLIKNKRHLPACFRARFRTHSEIPILTEKQDTGEEATILQTDAKKLALASSRAALGVSKSQKLSSQEMGAANACVIADHSTTEFAQKAVPTQPAGCHSNSDRYLKDALPLCKSCVQACLKAVQTEFTTAYKVCGQQFLNCLDFFRLSTLSSTNTITTAQPLHAVLSQKTNVRAKLCTSLVQAILCSAHANKPGLSSESQSI